MQRNKALLTHPEGKSLEKGISSSGNVDFNDMQDIQLIQDKCQQVSHALGNNTTVVRSILSHYANEPASGSSKTGLNFIYNLGVDADFQLSRVRNILSRLDGTFALVRNTPIT